MSNGLTAEKFVLISKNLLENNIFENRTTKKETFEISKNVVEWLNQSLLKEHIKVSNA